MEYKMEETKEKYKQVEVSQTGWGCELCCISSKTVSTNSS